MPHYSQDPSIRRYFNQGQPLSFARGDLILGNDNKPDGVYYISSGYVKIYSISDRGDEYVHIIYGEGEIFPMIWAYLDGQPDHLFYEALSECLVWRLSRSWFTKFVTANVANSHAMAIQLAHQSQFFSDRLDNLEYKKASERVAFRLLFLASRFGVRQAGGIQIAAPITHDLLASTINLSRERVSREMEKLEKLQIVKRIDHHIIIKDVNLLIGQLSESLSLQNWHL